MENVNDGQGLEERDFKMTLQNDARTGDDVNEILEARNTRQWDWMSGFPGFHLKTQDDDAFEEMCQREYRVSWLY